MPTVAITSQKGGSGKTTLALHLAACGALRGKQVRVIDADPQATAAAWGDWRASEGPDDDLVEIITCPPVRIGRTIQKAMDGGAELIVIDTPPHADSAAREAVRAADLVLIPSRPRAFDLHAIEATAALLARGETPAYVLLNAVPARATRLVEEAGEFIAGLGLHLCPVHFGDRAAFHSAAAAGRVAAEADPEGKAAAEVEALWNWVCGQTGMNPAG